MKIAEANAEARCFIARALSSPDYLAIWANETGSLVHFPMIGMQPSLIIQEFLENIQIRPVIKRLERSDKFYIPHW